MDRWSCRPPRPPSAPASVVSKAGEKPRADHGVESLDLVRSLLRLTDLGGNRSCPRTTIASRVPARGLQEPVRRHPGIPTTPRFPEVSPHPSRKWRAAQGTRGGSFWGAEVWTSCSPETASRDRQGGGTLTERAKDSQVRLVTGPTWGRPVRVHRSRRRLPHHRKISPEPHPNWRPGH